MNHKRRFSFVAAAAFAALAFAPAAVVRAQDAAAQPAPPERPYLGAMPSNYVVIRDVTPKSAAARAGVKSGDVILAVDGAPISSADEYGHIVAMSRNPTTEITVYRNRKTLKLVMRYDDAPKPFFATPPGQKKAVLTIKDKGARPVKGKPTGGGKVAGR